VLWNKREGDGRLGNVAMGFGKKERVLVGIEGQFDVDKLMAGDSGDKTN
jgi:hypothetical protein